MNKILHLTGLLLLLGTLSPAGLSAQMRFSGNIDWKATATNEDGSKSPRFENASFSLQTPGLPQYCEGLELNNGVAAAYELSFTRFETEEMPSSERQAIQNLEGLGPEPQLSYSVGQSAEVNRLLVCFYPYVLQNGMVRRVSSFEVEIKSVAATANTTSRALYKKGTNAANSVLNSEGWFKLAVSATSLYKITPAFLSQNGMANEAVSVSDLRVVGNGIGMLPEKNSAPRPNDLLEVPLKIYDGNNDGLFNGSDYAVFYARGPDEWKYNESLGRFTHVLNVYRDNNYYFVSVVNGSGARVDQATALPAAPTTVVTSFNDYAFVEDENDNLVGTGREWYGDKFDFNLTYNYDFSFPNLVKTEPVWLRVRAIGRASSGNTALVARVGGNIVLQNTFAAYRTGDYDPYATTSMETANINVNSDNFIVQLTYDNSSNPAGVAWLDYIEVNARRNLVYSGSPVYFRDVSSVTEGAVAEYRISGANPAMEVWEVTDHNDVRQMPLSLNNGVASFKNTAEELREYVAFAGSSMPEPTFVGAIPAQNLHGLDAAEMIIVAHPKFYASAKRLADFHLEQDNITSHLVTTEQVYNEYSSGGLDITAIRDFVRMNYEKANASGTAFNYLLLFGDASYDYKNRTANNSNYVPLYDGGPSLNLYSSSITDDYYAFLDPQEGGSVNDLSGNIMDIGVGRLPAASVASAEGMVDKVVHYTTSPERFGDWRNRILLMADDLDVPSGWESQFVADSEVLEDIVHNASEAFNVDKIYEDAYRQVSTTGGEAYPEASEDMFRKVQQGNLITNYIGHGGEIGLSSEKLLKLSDVNRWTNYDAMPLFLTITCEFTRLDDPRRVSAGEQLITNPNGGAIALLSTTRVVNAGDATNLNKAVFRTVFERPGNQPKTFGAMIRDAKNDPAIRDDQTKFKFSLFGDPAMKLAIPYYRIQTNTLNGKPFTAANLDTLKALSKVKVTGQVNDFNNKKILDFNGVANVSVYDKASQRETLVNDGIGDPLPFDIRNNLLYKGKVEVVNGDFSFEFIVPKDISYRFGAGKISLYAENGVIDAAGFNDSVMVGGFNEDAPVDNEGPVVKLYMNDESFVRGGITGEDPDLYAVISDSSGINTVGTGIGHDLVAILDGRTDQSYVVNEYYEADLNSYQEGSVRYPFYDLEEGEHTLKMKVFDVHNNFSEAETEFIVAESEDMALKRVLNYPNPFTTHTEFQFEHNRTNQPLEVQVQVFTVSGKLVKTINRLVVSEGNRVSDITWNGLDDYGDKIGKGVYVYRVKVRSQIDNAQADKYEKLVILR